MKVNNQEVKVWGKDDSSSGSHPGSLGTHPVDHPFIYSRCVAARRNLRHAGQLVLRTRAGNHCFKGEGLVFGGFSGVDQRVAESRGGRLAFGGLEE